MFLLEVEHLSCSLHAGRSLAGWGENRTILHDVTFAIEQGTCFGLLGPSGSGKSTIARCVAGLLQPDGGSIRFAGEVLFPRKRLRAPDPRIQLLFQASTLSLDPKRKVHDTIDEGFVPLGRDVAAEEKRKRTGELLEAVGLQRGILDRYPHELSGGQRQRVALMRSLASRPLLLILDEPTAALDPITQVNVLGLLRSLQRTLGLTLMYITHDRGTAQSFCDTIGLMNEGVCHVPS